MDFDLDHIYAAASEEAFAAVDLLAKRLSIRTKSELFDKVVAECGRAFKAYFERDHDMGLDARQKIVRGMIERTVIEDSHFQTLSNKVLGQIEREDRNLFDILDNLRATGTTDPLTFAAYFYKHKTFECGFLYGSWVDPKKLFLKLKNIEMVNNKLAWLFEELSNVNKDVKQIFNRHTTRSNTSFQQQWNALENILRDSNYPELAFLLRMEVTDLLKTHPDFAQSVVKRMYLRNLTAENCRTLFSVEAVLSSDQLLKMAEATASLQAFWGNICVEKEVVCLWLEHVVWRSKRMMEGVGAPDNTVVVVKTPCLDKDKIQDRRDSKAPTYVSRARAP